MSAEGNKLGVKRMGSPAYRGWISNDAEFDVDEIKVLRSILSRGVECGSADYVGGEMVAASGKWMDT